MPVTLFTEAYSSIIFAPQNFHDRAQDGDLLNRRWIEVNQTSGDIGFESYGVTLPNCPIDIPEPVDSILPDVDD